MTRPVTTAPANPRKAFTFRSDDSPLTKAQPSRVATCLTAHADQKPRERLLLYSLVFSLAPARCLEIGVRWGGGSRIIHAALSDLGQGVLVCIDPQPALEFDWNEVSDRATLLVGSSPAYLPRAAAAAGGLFDFVFIDGDHSQAGVEADLDGVAAVTNKGAVVLLHDAYHPPVTQAIEESLRAGNYRDCGLLATTRNDGIRVETGTPLTYGGVRMLRRT